MTGLNKAIEINLQKTEKVQPEGTSAGDVQRADDPDPESADETMDECSTIAVSNGNGRAIVFDRNHDVDNPAKTTEDLSLIYTNRDSSFKFNFIFFSPRKMIEDFRIFSFAVIIKKLFLIII